MHRPQAYVLQDSTDHNWHQFMYDLQYSRSTWQLVNEIAAWLCHFYDIRTTYAIINKSCIVGPFWMGFWLCTTIVSVPKQPCVYSSCVYGSRFCGWFTIITYVWVTSWVENNCKRRHTSIKYEKKVWTVMLNNIH
jgi:hypothetical protein